MKHLKKYLSILKLCFIAFSIGACDEKPVDPPIVIPPKTAASIFIGNEGQFTHGDASLTYIDITGNQTIQNAFYKVNNRALGDVLQSIYLNNDLIYLVVNNSNKIEVINRSDLKSKATITGLTSPRYMAFSGSSKAYVSSFYSPYLNIVDLNTKQVTGSIHIGGWQEDLLLIDHELFVSDYNHARILVVNTTTDQITDSIPVGIFPTSLTIDQYDRIWVGCNGDASNQAKLFCFDRNSHQIIKQINLSGSLLRKITTVPKVGDALYILSDNVQKIDFNDSLLIPREIIPSRGVGHNFYGLGIDPKTSELYVSDAFKFTTSSLIGRYNKDGTLLGQFLGGINTGYFLFYYE